MCGCVRYCEHVVCVGVSGIVVCVGVSGIVSMWCVGVCQVL